MKPSTLLCPNLRGGLPPNNISDRLFIEQLRPASEGVKTGWRLRRSLPLGVRNSLTHLRHKPGVK